MEVSKLSGAQSMSRHSISKQSKGQAGPGNAGRLLKILKVLGMHSAGELVLIESDEAHPVRPLENDHDAQLYHSGISRACHPQLNDEWPGMADACKGLGQIEVEKPFHIFCC